MITPSALRILKSRQFTHPLTTGDALAPIGLRQRTAHRWERHRSRGAGSRRQSSRILRRFPGPRPSVSGRMKRRQSHGVMPHFAVRSKAASSPDIALHRVFANSQFFAFKLLLRCGSPRHSLPLREDIWLCRSSTYSFVTTAGTSPLSSKSQRS